MLFGTRTILTFIASISLVAGQTEKDTARELPAWPEPTGPFVTGVSDFEFTDNSFPSNRREDENGRRIMVRAWYPSCPKEAFDKVRASCFNVVNNASEHNNNIFLGEDLPRRYYGPNEFNATVRPQIDGFADFIPLDSLYRVLEHARTWSYEDAPILIDEYLQVPLPVLVFSHGGISPVGQNTALMEEIASQGYAVFSVTHPGGASGIQYPNGDSIKYDMQYYADVLSISALDPNGTNSDDIEQRYEARKKMSVESGGLVSYVTRWAHDLIALVDFLEQKHNAMAIPQSDFYVRELLNQLLGGPNPSLQGQLIYGGVSFGGAASASAAQTDQRVAASWNIDGTHLYHDLFGTAVRVPFLTIATEVDGKNPSTYGYSNEFFFEPIESMGSNPDVVRLQIDNVSHFECMDAMFVPAEDRVSVPRGGVVNGTRFHFGLAANLLSFMGHNLQQGNPNIDTSQLPTLDAIHLRFPEFYPLDVSYVAEWYTSITEAHDESSAIGKFTFTQCLNSMLASALFFVCLM